MTGPGLAAETTSGSVLVLCSCEESCSKAGLGFLAGLAVIIANRSCAFNFGDVDSEAV